MVPRARGITNYWRRCHLFFVNVYLPCSSPTFLRLCIFIISRSLLSCLVLSCRCGKTPLQTQHRRRQKSCPTWGRKSYSRKSLAVYVCIRSVLPIPRFDSHKCIQYYPSKLKGFDCKFNEPWLPASFPANLCILRISKPILQGTYNQKIFRWPVRPVRRASPGGAIVLFLLFSSPLLTVSRLSVLQVPIPSLPPLSLASMMRIFVPRLISCGLDICPQVEYPRFWEASIPYSFTFHIILPCRLTGIRYLLFPVHISLVSLPFPWWL